MKILVSLAAILLLCGAAKKTNTADLTVANQTANDLGVCTFMGEGNSVQIEVGPYAQIDDPISFMVDSVIIDGQTVVEPSNGPVYLPNGSEIGVQWPAPNGIEITPVSKITTPIQ